MASIFPKYLDKTNHLGPTERNKVYQLLGDLYFGVSIVLWTHSSVWPRCYRTSTIKELGGWPVDDIYEGRYMEDMRMLLKIIPYYRFTWIDELMLYHRRHDSNNTYNLTETATALRYTIEDTLKSWGDIYSPIFKYEGDYMILDHLVVINLIKNEG